MTTDALLSYTYKLVGNEQIPFTKEEQNDRRRVLKRILKNTRFNNYTDEELDKIKVSQQNNGYYIITDLYGCEWCI